MDITLEKPKQADAEVAVLETLHTAVNYWDEPDTHFLVKQLEGTIFTNIRVGDFDEAVSHLQALTSSEIVSVFDLARHYDEAPGIHLYQIREQEIEQDLAAAINTILTGGNYKPINIRRIHQLVEQFADQDRTVRAA